MATWTKEHKNECLFIPEWIKQGKDAPDAKLANIPMFNDYDELIYEKLDEIVSKRDS